MKKFIGCNFRSGKVTGMGSLRSKGMVVLGGSSHPEIVKSICHHLDIEPGKCSVCFCSGGETNVNITETVRGM